MATFIIVIIAILATPPLTIWGVRFARRHRRMAYGMASLLLIFGLNMKVDPPPPPKTEAVEREDEKAQDDDPE